VVRNNVICTGPQILYSILQCVMECNLFITMLCKCQLLLLVVICVNAMHCHELPVVYTVCLKLRY